MIICLNVSYCRKTLEAGLELRQAEFKVSISNNFCFLSFSCGMSDHKESYINCHVVGQYQNFLLQHRHPQNDTIK